MSTNTKLAEAARQLDDAIKDLPDGCEGWLEPLDERIAELRAALAAQDAAQAQQAAGQEPYTSDRHFALREAHCIGDGEKFWKARPGTNKDNGRAIAFDDGYVRGFDKGTELADARAALAQRREPLTDEQIAEGRYRTWAAEPEDAPEAWSFMQGARWAEKTCAEAWGVKLGATTGEQR